MIWQATHGWPQLAMASALHQQNNSAGNYLGGLPAQLVTGPPARRPLGLTFMQVSGGGGGIEPDE
jgi:hypothetical protein